jgi:hypothetical protein
MSALRQQGQVIARLEGRDASGLTRRKLTTTAEAGLRQAQSRIGLVQGGSSTPTACQVLSAKPMPAVAGRLAKPT